MRLTSCLNARAATAATPSCCATSTLCWSFRSRFLLLLLFTLLVFVLLLLFTLLVFVLIIIIPHSLLVILLPIFIVIPIIPVLLVLLVLFLVGGHLGTLLGTLRLEECIFLALLLGQLNGIGVAHKRAAKRFAQSLTQQKMLKNQCLTILLAFCTRP